MCPLAPSTLSSVRGRRRSTSDPSARASLQELQAHIARIESNRSSGVVANAFSDGSCRLPLSLSQSLLLADLVTAFAPRSTWWSKTEDSDSWLMFGVVGEDSGPQVTVCISATSDRDVLK